MFSAENLEANGKNKFHPYPERYKVLLRQRKNKSTFQSKSPKETHPRIAPQTKVELGTRQAAICIEGITKPK